MTIRLPTAGAVLALGFIGGCAANGPVPTAAAPTDPAPGCTALAQKAGAALGEPTAHIVTAKFNAASQGAPGRGGAGLPAHCELIGAMRERTGTDGQHYAVKFHVRLPAAWNGRFLYQGGGGTNGVLGDATGAGALAQGYAVASTDTGHDNATNNIPALQGQVSFAHEYQARIEHGERALDSVATTAKRIIRLFYGRPPKTNYFVGCSNGGREGMVFAQRYPDQFDGIVASAPAFAVPKAALASAWDTQTYAGLAKKMGLNRADGLPDTARAVTEAELAIAADAVAKTCDGDDGAVDGMIQNVVACTTARVRPALEAKVCTGAKTNTCLSRDQVDALIRNFEGPRNGKGEALYSDWAWDVGISTSGWRMWKTGVAPGSDSINVSLLSPALSGLFITPPPAVASSSAASFNYMLSFDFDRDAPKIFGTSKEFPRSGWDVSGAQSTNLERFRRHGGKMLVPHGGSDPIFSIRDTVSWWSKVDAARGGKAADFVRVYAVPGMNHCGGGPATDQYDALASLVAWVEEGKAPDRIEAKAGPASPWPGRARPLCPYPSIARYRSGDINKSESFVCEARKA